MSHKQYCEAHICSQKINTIEQAYLAHKTHSLKKEQFETTQQLKVQVKSKNHLAKHRMKSNKETTKIKSYSSSSIRKWHEQGAKKKKKRNTNPFLNHKHMRKIKGRSTKSSRK